jgi:hypothetical protein
VELVKAAAHATFYDSIQKIQRSAMEKDARKQSARRMGGGAPALPRDKRTGDTDDPGTDPELLALYESYSN